ncbi:hypothetical protein AXG93_411s1250 [Marchantia polymorpha subsp. ruderalis]|uniref:Uncharacterized protein n=1 Tax=Marchantia polymorpha subsp. ruderalis TaxID=1480154 RepID=A0A176VFN5_MARPO|nr:hypothetical protein AXG93_411s1250 [Marchantia polymorpha subsp. ruderalis]
MPFLVNFYCEMSLLTKSEEKRFPKEKEILESNKDEESEQEEARAEETILAASRGPVRVEVVTEQDGRPAKRQKIAEFTVAARRSEAQMASSATTRFRMPKTRARSKKKAQHRVVLLESSESSVDMSKGIASSADEDAVEGDDLQTLECGSLGKRMSSEKRSRSLKKADVPEPKTGEEYAKELTLDHKILEQVVEQIGETVVESREILSPQVSSGMAKPEVDKRPSAEDPKEVVVTFPDFLECNVVSLLKYLDEKREKYVVSE